jgi:hypothetical protein
MSISQLYPAEGPTLNLNFAGSRTLDPRITFTRTQTTSNGSTYTGRDGLIKYAGPNEPRFDHRYVNGEIESLGLLIEEQRTNSFPTSEVFVSGWGGPGTPNTDTILNPYGILSAVYYITGNEWVRNFNGNNTTVLSLSFFTKIRPGGSGSTTYIQIYQETAIGEPSNVGVYNFNMTGSNPDSGRFTNITRTEYPNGWYRFTCRVASNPSAGQGTFTSTTRIDLEGALTTNYVWGIQVETGSEFATSYIPTEGSTKTRTADNASITGSNFIEWYGGILNASIVVNCKTPLASTGVDNRIISFRPTSGTNSYDITFRLGNNPTISLRNISDYALSNQIIPFDTTTRISASISSGDLAISCNGESPVTSSASITGTFDVLDIGRFNPSPYRYLNSTISQLIYYPTRLPNSQLIVLTR